MANFLDDYEPVEDRLRAFWHDWPGGRVVTVLLEPHTDGDYIVRAELFTDGEQFPAASGYAHDSEAQLPPNMKASALEVCETSAIGRALANLGYAAKGKRPSREEMSKASGEGHAIEREGESPDRTRASAGHGASPGTTSTDGEAVGDGTGGGSQTSPGATTKDAPGPPHYPLRPDECDHKNERTNHLLRPRKSPRGPVCPRCGLSYITVTEGTTKDLGAA